MTGPEHYREAEGILAILERRANSLRGKSLSQVEAEGERADITGSLAAAQVHATLALAAATATGHSDGMGLDLANEWYKATAPERAAS